MPTSFTRAAGTVALIASLGWIASALAHLWQSDLYQPFQDTRAFVWMAITFVTAVASVVALAGLLRRAGGRRDLPTVAALVLGSLGAVLSSMTWGWPIWMPLLAAGFLVAVLRVRATTGRQAGSDWLLVAGPTVGIAVYLALDALQFGARDGYGDYPAAVAVGYVIAAVLTALGFAGIGRWLRSEEPVDLPDTAATA